MKTILALSLAMLGAFCSPEVSKIPDSQEQPPDCQCVTDALSEIKNIKVGMKRKDLDKIFSIDGGLSVVDEARFVYIKCSYIKVKVRFELVEPLSDASPEDEIIEISKPYLEYPVWN